MVMDTTKNITDSITAHDTLKNSFFGLISYTWPAAIAIFITPIIVFSLGIAEYGVYILINTVTSILYLLAMGIGTSAIKHISGYLAQNESQKTEALVYSLNSLFLAIGIVGATIFVLLGFCISNVLRPDSVIDYQGIFILAGIFFLFSSISSTFDLILSSIRRFDLSMKINLLSMTLTSVGMLVLSLNGYKLKSIILLQIIVIILVIIINRVQCGKVFKYSHLKYRWDISEIKKNYKFGFFVFLSDLANSSLTYLDKLLIPAFLGAASLTYYSLPGSISSRISGISNSLSASILPLTSNLNSVKDQERIVTLYKRSTRLLTMLSSIITLVIILQSKTILSIWLNNDFALTSENIFIILALTHFLISLQNPITKFLFAIGETKFVAKISSAMAILNLVLLLILLPRFGIIGAAYAYLLSITPIFFVYYHTEKKYLKINLLKENAILFFKIIAVTIPIYFINNILIQPFVVSIQTLLLSSFLLFFIYITAYRFFGFFENDDWEDIKNVLHSILLKISWKK